DDKYVTAQEQLGIFVYWMVHGSSQQELQERFQRSGDTISRCIIIYSLAASYIAKGLQMFTGEFYQKYVQDPRDETPDKIKSNSRWYPFFKYCRGATDGVHFLAY
ncbi:hypothetical protein C8J57DRAFT_996098, partial [Mycena rebaudengoi]